MVGGIALTHVILQGVSGPPAMQAKEGRIVLGSCLPSQCCGGEFPLWLLSPLA